MISEKSFSSASSRYPVTKMSPSSDWPYIYLWTTWLCTIGSRPLEKHEQYEKFHVWHLRQLGQTTWYCYHERNGRYDIPLPKLKDSAYEELYSSFQKGSGTQYAFDSLILETNLLHSPKAVVGTYVRDEFVKYFLALNIAKVSLRSWRQT